MAGLSPRVRGNPHLLVGQERIARSIPACTGEPNEPEPVAGQYGVYPRVYGGTLSRHADPAIGIGLSPRVRGNRSRGTERNLLTRSIPACTGEPFLMHGKPSFNRVYPRVYGGTPPARGKIRPRAGLSPRVRGNPIGISYSFSCGGSIPACTGEPPYQTWQDGDHSVYPRVYGGTFSPGVRA